MLKGIGNNYIYNASTGTDIIRWDIKSFPLKVYIKNDSDIPSYYVSNIRSALKQWANRTTFVKFTEVNNESDANIVIKFRDIDSSVCTGNICKYVVAYTEPSISNNILLKKMYLTFYKTNPKRKAFLPREIYSTALHEVGHTLGIMGHSDNPADIMYAAQESNSRDNSIFGNQILSQRDLNTLVLLYRTKPTVSNTWNISSESFYYAPLVIGNDDVLISKKINELKKYIQEYPKFATGYINLGGAYADMGDFENALIYMQKAEPYAKTDDERYLISYNRAIIYYNMKQKAKAMQYAQQAQGYKADPAVNELIQEIQNMK